MGGGGASITCRRCYTVNTRLSSHKHKQNPVERLAASSFEQLVKNEPAVQPPSLSPLHKRSPRNTKHCVPFCLTLPPVCPLPHIRHCGVKQDPVSVLKKAKVVSRQRPADERIKDSAHFKEGLQESCMTFQVLRPLHTECIANNNGRFLMRNVQIKLLTVANIDFLTEKWENESTTMF